jgi:hypothetical protein
MDVVVDGLTFAEAPRWRDGKGRSLVAGHRPVQ